LQNLKTAGGVLHGIRTATGRYSLRSVLPRRRRAVHVLIDVLCITGVLVAARVVVAYVRAVERL